MIKRPFVKQRSEAAPATAAVTAASRRETARPERVSGIRVLSVTAALLIIHVGWFRGRTQRQATRRCTPPGCWMSDSVVVFKCHFVATLRCLHLKETLGTRSPSICNRKMPVQTLRHTEMFCLQIRSANGVWSFPRAKLVTGWYIWPTSRANGCHQTRFFFFSVVVISAERNLFSITLLQWHMVEEHASAGHVWVVSDGGVSCFAFGGLEVRRVVGT